MTAAQQERENYKQWATNRMAEYESSIKGYIQQV